MVEMVFCPFYYPEDFPESILMPWDRVTGLHIPGILKKVLCRNGQDMSSHPNHENH